MNTTTSTSTAIAVAEPMFTNPERLALAGFLAGYTGLTQEAHAFLCRERHNIPYDRSVDSALPAARRSLK